MKKNGFAALLAASALLCGCASDQPVPDSAETTVPPQTETSAEAALSGRTTAAPEETENSGKATGSPAGNGATLDEIPLGELQKRNLTADENVRDILALPSTLEYSSVRYLSPMTLSAGLSDDIEFRYSTREMGDSVLEDAANAPAYFGAASVIAGSVSDPVLEIGKIEGDTIFIDSARLEYSVSFEEPRMFRGFARISSANNAEMILEPADLRDIPVLSRREADLTFTVNGETVTADTVSVRLTGEDVVSAIEKQVGAGSTDYVYASFSAAVLRFCYSTESGYENFAIGAEDFQVITTDTAAVIRGDSIYGGGTGSSEAEELYSALMNHFDQFYDEKTVGIVLLDMDFDGAPELLVSRQTEGEGNENCVDVSVYRIRDGAVMFLDTIAGISGYPAFSMSGGSAVLGLKTFENGQKAWFAMTGEYREDAEKGGCLEKGKLYTLENGKIREEELFSLWQRIDPPELPRIYFGDTPAGIAETGGNSCTVSSPWGEFSGYDSMSVYYALKNGFCESIERNVVLLSDWLVPTVKRENSINTRTDRRFSPSLRDRKNAVAFLVDSYCFGDYSADFGGYVYDFGEMAALKPVIYLYPEEKTEVSVSVDFPGGGGFTCTYPDYGKGWNVTALPDGTLCDESGNAYYCLYWEGAGLPLAEPEEGWCVPGTDTAGFLREKLLEIGLTAREANEMIIYWLPQMQKNPYNLISFHFEDYDRAAPLTVSPAPDSVIRVFMTYKALTEPTAPKPQVLPHGTREGFTLVEWGGCEVRQAD